MDSHYNYIEVTVKYTYFFFSTIQLFTTCWYNILYSLCRDCTDLTLEVTYTGKPVSPFDGEGATFEQFQSKHLFKVSAEEWLSKMQSRLAWMKSLESLVLIKLGPYATFDAGERVISLLLDSLVRGYLFPRLEQNQNPLRWLWIQNFEVYRFPALIYCPDSLQSYRSGDCGDIEDKKFESYCNIQHLGGNMGIDFSHPLPSLQKLKYVSGNSYDDGKVNHALQNTIFELR